MHSGIWSIILFTNLTLNVVFSHSVITLCTTILIMMILECMDELVLRALLLYCVEDLCGHFKIIILLNCVVTIIGYKAKYLN